MNIIRQAIKAARAAYTRIRKEWSRLRHYKERMAFECAHSVIQPWERPSAQDQHRIACLTAYEAKKWLARQKKGRNTLEGIPA